MSKQILVLCGSPRRGGNSDLLAQAFADAAKQAGHTAELFFAAANPVSGCLVCERCWENSGAPCVQKDAMQQLYPLLNTADVIVFSTPLYYFGFSAQLKAVIDRFYPLSKEGKAEVFADKQTFLIICGASEDEVDYEAVTQHYETLVDYLGWEDCGVLAVQGVQEKGAVKNTDWMDAVRELVQAL